MQWLIIKSSSLEAETVEYALLGKDQQQDNFSRSGWSQLKGLSRGKRVILLIPTEDVVLNSANIPASNQKLLTKAVPYALEDSLAEDIDTLHFVHYRESDQKDVNILAINKTLLQQWIDKLKQHELSAHFILPDVFALPIEADAVTLSMALDQPRVLVRDSTFSGFASDYALISALLPSVLEASEAKTLLLDKPDNLELAIPEAIAVKAGNLSHTCSDSLLQTLPLNLLNRFAQEGSGDIAKYLAPWKSVAALIMAIAGLWAVSIGMENYRLNQRLEGLNSSITQVYEATFPGEPVNDDYRVLHSIMSEKLKALTSNGTTKANSPLEILANIAPKIKQHKGITVSTVRFDDSGLNLAITAPSLSLLEKFRAAVDTDTINAEVISSTSSANKVESTLLIKKVSL